MRKLRILITGMAGFIGFHLTSRLVEAGHTVTGIDNVNNYYSTRLKWDRLLELGLDAQGADWREPVASTLYDSLTFFRVDLADKSTLNKIFEQEHFDYVINLAAQAGVRYSLENPESYVQSNVVGFLNLLECCRAHPVKHLIYASSSSVYGLNTQTPFSEEHKTDQPASLYAATKKSNELMAHCYSHLFAIPTTGLRFFTVYGEWGRPDMSPVLFAERILSDKPIDLFNYGNMSRDFTYVGDIVSGIISILGMPPAKTPPFRVLNIGGNQPVELLEFVKTMERCLDKSAKIEFKPMQPGDVEATYANIDNIAALTGFCPSTSLEDGLARFCDWYKNYSERVEG